MDENFDFSNFAIRTLNGSNNAGDIPGNGQARSELTRLFEPAYEALGSVPRGGGTAGFPATLPNPRDISNVVHKQVTETPNFLGASQWLFQWGQFLDHDLGLVEGSTTDPFVIPIFEFEPDGKPDPLYDPDGPEFQFLPFGRVPVAEGTGTSPSNPREHENENTSLLDGSNGYGSDIFRAAAKRSDLGNSFYGLAGLDELAESLLGEEASAVPIPVVETLDGTLITSNSPFNTTGQLNPGGGIDPQNTSGEVLLPYNRALSPNANPFGNVETEFISGDIRTNEQSGLTAIHTVFVREHNLVNGEIAAALEAGDPGLTAAYEFFSTEYFEDTVVPFIEESLEEAGFTESEITEFIDDISEEQIKSEFLYEATRTVVDAKSQIITYTEFLPILIGNDPAERGDDLKILTDEFGEPLIEGPGVSQAFTAAAYRLGHTLLPDELNLVDINGVDSIALQDAFFDPDFVSENGVDQLLTGLIYAPSAALDNQITDAVRQFLFRARTGGFDLAAVNIQRGREVGIPGYTEVYEEIFGEEITSFEDLVDEGLMSAEVVDLLEVVYDNVDQIDLWVAGISELPADHGGLLGPTLSAIVEDQFARLRFNDEFFYTDQLEDPNSLLSIVTEAIDLDLSDFGLGDVIRPNVAFPELIPDDVFITPDLTPIIGTEFDDELDGTGQDDVVYGQGGDDQIEGKGNDDILFGGMGDDDIRGGGDDDIILGGDGDDDIRGGGGADNLRGGAGDDILRGNGGADTFWFGSELLDGTNDEDIIRNFRASDILDFSGYIGAGGTVAFEQKNPERLEITLNNDVFGPDFVTVRGDVGGINAAVEQLNAII